MIEITFMERKIIVTGHSGYAAIGSDIVCAGVSALFQTLVKALSDLTDDEIYYTIASGKSSIEYETLSKEALILIDYFFIGVSMISVEYPKYVRINNKSFLLGQT